MFLQTEVLTGYKKSNGLSNKCVNSIVNLGSYIFAGTNSGVFVSTDNGITWAARSWGFCSVPYEVTSMTVIGSTLFAFQSAGCGIYRSVNYGLNWYSVSNGLPSSYFASCLGTDGTNLYAGTTYDWGDYSTGMYMSTNLGNTWSNFDNNQIKGVISGIRTSGQNVFACTSNEYLYPWVIGGVYKTSNNGLNWNNISEGLNNMSLKSIVNTGSYIFTCNNGLYLSSNSGVSWNTDNSPQVRRNINVLAYSGNNLYAGSKDSGIFVSSNYGVQWSKINIVGQNIGSRNVVALGAIGNTIFAGIYLENLYISTNQGAVWKSLDTAMHSTDIRDLIVSGTEVFACFYTGGICRSTNSGANWTRVNNGIPYPYYYCMGLAKDSLNIYACFYWGNGIYMSSNNGDSWSKISGELSNLNFNSIAAYHSRIFAATDSVIYYSSNNGSNWNIINEGLPAVNANPFVNKLSISNGYLYAATNYRSLWKRPLSDFILLIKTNTEKPTEYMLSQNYPNPFNPATKISFALPKQGLVTIKVFDVLGKEIETLVNESLKPGTYGSCIRRLQAAIRAEFIFTG